MSTPSSVTGRGEERIVKEVNKKEKVIAINPEAKQSLLIALQNLSFLIAAARHQGIRERYYARRLFNQLARLQALATPLEEEVAQTEMDLEGRRNHICVSEQILIAVPPAYA